jgi:transcriptional regulator with XRE-family HTH domain
MNIERSSFETRVEFANTSSIKEQVLEGLKTSKEYRHAFIEESIRSRIAAQIKALQDAKEWDYKRFADKIDKKVSWVYRLEDPNAAPPTIPTLLQVAQAFDIGLDVRFRAFSELLDDVASLDPESFVVPSFDEELKSGSFSRGKHRRRFRGNNNRRRGSRPVKRSHQAEDSRVVYIGANLPHALPLAS